MPTKLKLPRNLTHFFLIIILILAFFFRFYHLYSWQFFGMDQEYEAFIIKNILTIRHLPLIGVNASDTGLYLGPAFIYIATIPYLLFHGDPIGGSIMASFLGIITTILIYKLGIIWFSKRIGLLASFFWAVSFLAVLYDRQFWNPTPIALLFVLILYSLTKIIKGSSKFFLLLGISLGLALQSHLQAIIFLPIIFIYLLKYRERLSKKFLLLFFIIILAFQVPLVLFDLRHNFTNLRAVNNLILSLTSKHSFSSSVFSRMSLFQNTIGRAFFIKTPVDLYVENGQCQHLIPYIGKTENIISFLALIVFTFYTYRSLIKKDKTIKDSFLIPVVTILTLAVVVFYNRQIYEYYFLFYLPIVFLFTAWFLNYIFSKGYQIIVIPIIFIFFLANFRIFLEAKIHYAYNDKINAIRFASEFVDRNDFSLEAVGGCGIYGGYRYLFEYYGKRPGSSYMDAYFSWLYGQPSKKYFPKTVFFYLKDNREENLSSGWTTKLEDNKKRMITERQFGNILVEVINNEAN